MTHNTPSPMQTVMITREALQKLERLGLSFSPNAHISIIIRLIIGIDRITRLISQSTVDITGAICAEDSLSYLYEFVAILLTLIIFLKFHEIII
jgi:hypothetical protein